MAPADAPSIPKNAERFSAQSLPAAAGLRGERQIPDVKILQTMGWVPTATKKISLLEIRAYNVCGRRFSFQRVGSVATRFRHLVSSVEFQENFERRSIVKRLILLCVVECFLVGLLVGQPAATSPTHVVAIKCAHLLNVKTGVMASDQVVLVEGERIQAVGSAREVRIPAGAKVIDLGNATLLPGLIDAHTHLFLHPGSEDGQTLRESLPRRTIDAIENAKADLMAGFTSERDCGTEGAKSADVDVRNAINAGEILGPRMEVSTQAISIYGGHEDYFGYNPEVGMIPNAQLVEGIDGPDGLISAIRSQVKEGADFIKIYVTGAEQVHSLTDVYVVPQFSLPELKAAVAEAKRLGKFVAVHAGGGLGTLYAAEAGVHSIEHGYYADNDTFQVMKRKGIWLVPTFTVTEWFIDHDTSPAGQARGRIVRQLRHEHFQMALAAGVKIAMGSDVGPFPHGTQGQEFSWMVKYGMTPLASIQAGTINAAELMGRSDQVGSIEVGKLADLVAVPDDPLKNIDTLQHTIFVMKGGVVYKNLLAEGKQ